MGCQCDISLPEGLTLELKTNGKPKGTLGERFKDTDHSISSSKLANGDYRFIVTSMDGDVIPGTSGTLFSVTIISDASLAAGTKLTGTVKNIEFNTKDNQKLTFNDESFSVNIRSSVAIGDVNGDGEVNVGDAVCIVNYVMGKPNSTFTLAAADANNDGVVNMADAIYIVNFVVGKIPT